MKRSLLLYLFIAFCAINTSAFVHGGNYKIDDKLYNYVTLCQKNLKNQGVGLSMLDTLYMKAKRAKDLNVECLALYYRVNYYHLHQEPEKERMEFRRIAPLILRTSHIDYYFRAWNVIIAEDINNLNFQDALNGLIKFKEEASRMKNEYGIVRGYMITGDFYLIQHFYRLALSQYRKILVLNSPKDDANLVSLYTRIGQCCMWLHRWDESEEYLLKAISCSDEFAAVVPRMLLLSLYCRKDVKDKEHVEQAYHMVQKAISTYPPIASDYNFYAECMSDYHTLYQHCDSTFRKKFSDMPICVDSLNYYTDKAKRYEAEKNYELSSLYYRKFGDYVNTLRMNDEQFLLSSFVPQMEYWKLGHEKEMQRQQHAKMKLQQSLDNGLLLSLCNERDRAALQDRLKEQKILRNRLAFQKMMWEQGRKKLANARLRAEQLGRSSALFKEKEYWRILCINLVVLALVALFIIYVLNYYFTRKRLRREKEKAEKSEHIKSLFFQNMNHEIRNPLNAIMGFNEILNSEIGSNLSRKEKADYIGMIETNSQLLLKLVNDVLDLSNFEGGTYQLTPTDTDIYHLCHTALESVRGRQNEGVELLLKRSPEVSEPYMLHTDAQRLQQVLTNYLTNACKYTERGSITLSYELMPDKVRFAVTDTGPGIKPEDAEKVFERFQMLDKTKRGTGLGLHICRIISKLLHGKAYVDTQYSEGARFVFDHPLKALLSFLIVCCCSLLSVHAQNNPLHIKDHLYLYYEKVERQLNTPQGGLMTDTLFAMARRSGDIDAQCLALVSKTKHYRYSSREDLLLKSFRQCEKFCLSKSRNKYLFKAWGYVINYYLYHKDFKKALSQLQLYQNLMLKLNDSYGISTYFYEVGNYYTMQQQNATALSYYLKALHTCKEERRSIYTLIGRSYFLLKDYKNSVLYTKKALGCCKTDVARVNPVMILTQCYCMLGRKSEAVDMLHELERLQRENPTRVSFANFYSTIYCYYTFVEHDKEKALEALLASGNNSNPENIGAFYFSKHKYEVSNKYYKDYKKLSEEWLNTDWGDLFDAYVSRFDFEESIKQRNRLFMENIRLQTEAADKKKQLLMLKHQKNRWLLHREDINIRQKRGELNLQNMLVAKQQVDVEKQQILDFGLKTRRQLYEQRVWWCLVSIVFTSLFLMALSGTIVYRLRRKQKRLSKETFIAEATERAKNHFYQRVNDKIYTSLHDIVSLNRRLNSEETSVWSDVRKAELMRKLTRQSKYLNSVVNNVLDISKIESGTCALQISTVDVDMLCHLVLNKIKSEVPPMVSLSFRSSRGVSGDHLSPLLLQTDESRLIFVLVTYLSNACRHTIAGSIVLAYDVLPDKIRFSVTDTGRSLSSEERAMIFTRYLSNNTAGNLGLSLYLVSLIAGLLSGRAYADSTTASGACFVLELPLS